MITIYHKQIGFSEIPRKFFGKKKKKKGRGRQKKRSKSLKHKLFSMTCSGCLLKINLVNLNLSVNEFINVDHNS